MMLKRPLCLAALIFALSVRLILCLYSVPDRPYEALDRKTVTIAGTIGNKQFELSDNGELKLQITLSEITSESSYSNDLCVGGKVLAAVDPEADKILPIGGRVEVTGTLRTFSKPTNHGEFNSRLYYTIQKTEYQIKNAEINRVQESAGCFDEHLYRIRRKIAENMDETFSERDAAVMKAVLLGEKGWLPKDLKELYQDNGIIHILAISGLHISILGMGLYKFLRRISIRIPERCFKTGRGGTDRLLYIPIPAAAGISIIFMILYGRMTGMGPSSCRAVCMFSIRLGAVVFKRTYDMLTGLAIAMILILASQPLYLLYSGFLFSFSAVLGIGGIMPLFDKSNYLMRGLAVPIMILPVYMMSDGCFPVYSILLNVMVLPLMTGVLAAGSLCAVLGTLPFVIRAVPAFLIHFILYFYYALCTIAGNLPGKKLILGSPEPLCVVLFLAAVFGLIIWGERLPEFLRAVILLSAVMILVWKPDKALAVHMADVGQGDGIIIENKDHAVMIDGGSSDHKSVFRYTLEPLLNYYGIGKLDMVIVTHADNDHCSGISEMLTDRGSASRIGMLLLPDCAEAVKSEKYKELEEQAAENAIPVGYLSKGEQILLGDLKIDILHPEKETMLSDNEMSAAFLLQYGDFTGLFTGDLEGEGEKETIACLEKLKEVRRENDGRVDITLLKAAHHGSEGATSEAFLHAVDPKIALISAGRSNQYGHPHKALLERLTANGTEIYNTQSSGEITFETDGIRMKIGSFLKTSAPE